MRTQTNAGVGERPSKARVNFRVIAFYAILALAPILVLTLAANAFFRIWQREVAQRFLEDEGFDCLFEPESVWLERFVGEFESLRDLQVARMHMFMPNPGARSRKSLTAEMSRALAAFPECVRVEIFGHDVSVDFLEQLSRNEGLRELQLSDAAIDAKCCKAISDFASLESIYVSSNLSVDDAAALLLLKTPGLESLNLWGTSITDEFCSGGAGRSLAYLDLEKTKVSAAGLAKCCRWPGMRCVAGSLPKALVLEHGDPRLVYRENERCFSSPLESKAICGND